MIKLVTFHTPDMSRAAELCARSSLLHGVEEVESWTRDELEHTGFYYSNREILDEPRGSGLWAWKPFIILQAMRGADTGDVIVYSDAGVEFINNLHYITDRLKDVFLFGNQYEHAHWCKRDVIEAITPGWEWSQFGKQIQASVLFFRVSAYSKRLVSEWLKLCTNKHLIDDSPSVAPNHPEFQEHRHDQAILTTLAYRDEIELHWWPAQYNDGAFVYPTGQYEAEYPVLVHHHRRRNGEWHG